MLPLQLLRNWFAPIPRPRRRGRFPFATPQALESRCLLVAPFTLTDHEQLLVELLNRARLDPVAEAARFSISLNSGLNPGELTDEPRPPLAPQQMLINSAFAHGADMLQRDYFSHTTLGTTKSSRERAAEQNYTGLVGENLSWGGSTAQIDQILHVHERHESLFRSPGHRKNLLRSTYNELGVTVQFGLFKSSGTDYNASMVVQNFGTRGSKPYITGVVYADTTDNNVYDIGEAIRTGVITAVNLDTSQQLTTEITNSGGYALEVSPGKWAVEASYEYSGFGVRSVSLVEVGPTNLKLDFERFTSGVVDPVVVRTERTSIFEQGADSTTTLVVSQAVARSIAVTVQLSTDAPSALRLPTTIVIPPGQLNASIQIEGIPDDLIEAAQTANIDAVVPGLSSTQTTLTILDRTTPRFPAPVQLVQSARPLLTWSTIANAAFYEIWGDNNTTGQSRAAYATNLTTPAWIPNSDLGLGDWTFYVRATSADGRRSFWSFPAVRQIRPVPTLIPPSAPLPRANAVLQWAELAGAAAWEIWVDSINPRSSRIVYQTEIPGNSFKLPELPIGNYAWWARARNSALHYSPWTARGLFTITDRVATITPIPGQFSPDLNLSWPPIPGASAYDVWVDDRTRNIFPAFRNPNVLTNSIRIPGLLPAITRIWIRTKDTSGNWHPWSLPTDIAHQLPPAITFLAGTSANSAVSNPLKLAWTPVSSAARYSLRIANLADQTIYQATNLSTPRHDVAVTIPPGRYRVWLAAVDSADSQRLANPFEITLTAATNPPSSPSASTPPGVVAITLNLLTPPTRSFPPPPNSSRQLTVATALPANPADSSSHNKLPESPSQQTNSSQTSIHQIHPFPLNDTDYLFQHFALILPHPQQELAAINADSPPSKPPKILT